LLLPITQWLSLLVFIQQKIAGPIFIRQSQDSLRGFYQVLTGFLVFYRFIQRLSFMWAKEVILNVQEPSQ
jgi:hypothetical protein